MEKQKQSINPAYIGKTFTIGNGIQISVSEKTTIKTAELLQPTFQDILIESKPETKAEATAKIEEKEIQILNKK